jgi:hypothetical protein
VPTIPEDETYEGTEIDKNVLDGKHSAWKSLWRRESGKLSIESSSVGYPCSLVATHGASSWAISTKIDAELADGSNQSYCMKVLWPSLHTVLQPHSDICQHLDVYDGKRTSPGGRRV